MPCLTSIIVTQVDYSNSFSKKALRFITSVDRKESSHPLNEIPVSRSRIHIQSSLFHLLALAGIEKPLVMKSLCFPFAPLFEENRLFRLSFVPSRRFFCRSSCSLRTLAVSAAVASFLIFPELALASLSD